LTVRFSSFCSFGFRRHRRRSTDGFPSRAVFIISFLVKEFGMLLTSQLEVYEAGELTVVGFGGREILDRLSLGDCRHELSQLIEQHGCKTLAFDLTGVRLIPSGMLGLLCSIRQQGIDVHLYNPSRDVREVLEITKLDSLLELHEVEV